MLRKHYFTLDIRLSSIISIIAIKDFISFIGRETKR
jgi:hypothetical protein